MSIATDLEDDYIHPLDLHALRPPMTNALVHVLVYGYVGQDPRAELVADGLMNLLGNRAGTKIIAYGDRNEAINHALDKLGDDLLVITAASEEWSKVHLSTLLTCIDKCDHAIGRRRNVGMGLTGWLRRLPWRLILALPVHDLYSCCRLHRIEALRKIPLKSHSAFLDIEILAKATFFGHLIGEEDVPELQAMDKSSTSFADIKLVLGHPTFLFDPKPTPEVIQVPSEETAGAPDQVLEQSEIS